MKKTSNVVNFKKDQEETGTVDLEDLLLTFKDLLKISTEIEHATIMIANKKGELEWLGVTENPGLCRAMVSRCLVDMAKGEYDDG